MQNSRKIDIDIIAVIERLMSNLNMKDVSETYKGYEIYSAVHENVFKKIHYEVTEFLTAYRSVYSNNYFIKI